MTPDQVLFVVRAAVQVGNAVDQAWQQKLRDEGVIAPNVATAKPNIWRQIDTLFRGELKVRVSAGGDLAQYWDSTAVNGTGGCRDDDEARDELRAAAEEYWGCLPPSPTKTGEGLMVLQQWRQGEGPPAPYVRIAVSLANLAADYAKVNPGIFRVGGKAEPIIVAIAEQIPKLLPDPDSVVDAASWNLNTFAERALTTFLHAGLSVVQAHPDYVASEEHVQALLSNSLKPMVDLFKAEADAGKKLDLAALQETLVGPVAKAALKTIAERQTEFLGDDLATSKAAGAIVGSVLGLWQKEGLEKAFSTAGFQKLASTSLEVVMAHPALFVGRDQDAKDALARDLLAGVAKAIKQRVDPGGRGLAKDLLVEIGVEALEAVGKHAENFVDRNKPWDRIAGSAMTQVAEGLAVALKAKGAASLEDVFSRERAITLGRAILQEAAATPGMLVEGGDEIKQIVAAVAAAMAADDNLLLGQDEWKLIAATVAEEAARNPGRLFKLDGTKPEDQLGARLIASVLQAAAADFRQHRRKGGGVALGEVVADAVVQTLKAAVGNLQGAAKAVALVQAAGAEVNRVATLVTTLCDFARQNSDKFGWREWRWVFRNLVVDAIDQAAFAVTPERILKLLETQPATDTA